MFRHDCEHSGRSLYDTSQNSGTLKWTYDAGEFIFSSAAVGSDGTIYVGLGDANMLAAVNGDGTVLWNFNADGYVYSSPAIDSEGSIYISSGNGTFYSIRRDGTEKWNLPLAESATGATIGPDGTIYVGTIAHRLHALNPDGTEKWSFEALKQVNSAPAIAPDGTVYFGSADGYLYALFPDGTLKWTFRVGDVNYSSAAIAPDGTVYIGSLQDEALYAVRPDGTLKWVFKTGVVESSPAIGADGTIYVGSRDGFYAIAPNGTLLWKYGCGPVSSSPAIGLDGTIFVAGELGPVWAFNPDGTPRWTFPLGVNLGTGSSPAIGSDGTIYIGAEKFFAIGGESQTDCPPLATVTCKPPYECLGPTTTVSLEGNGLDPDDPLTFEWSRWDGMVISRDAMTTYTISGGPGQYLFHFKVTTADGEQSDARDMTVTVQDTQPPVLLVPSPIIDECQGQNGTPEALVAAASDGCTSAAIRNDFTSGGADASGRFPLGKTVIRFQAQDESGNRVSDATWVLIEDTRAPAITCPNPLTLDADSQCIAQFVPMPIATDNCDGSPRTLCYPEGPYALGLWPIGCIAIDHSGNFATCTSSVRVQDVSPPQVSCGLDPVGITSDEDEDENGDGFIDNRFTVRFSAVDNCDADPCCHGTLNGLDIHFGEEVVLGLSPTYHYSISEADDADEDGDPDGLPQKILYGPRFTLEASCVDFSGNSSEAPCRSILSLADEEEDL
jgi:outer membrane protein assembly factor BamB